MSRRAEILILLAILAVATCVRLWGIDWGLPHPYHPDEGSVLFHSLGFGTGDLNPHWFRWPSLSMYEMFGVYGVYFVIGKLSGLFAAPADLAPTAPARESLCLRWPRSAASTGTTSPGSRTTRGVSRRW